MSTEPELLTDHTDIICSTSIERIVTSRHAALKQIESLHSQLCDVSLLISSIGGGTVNDWISKQAHRNGCWLTEKIGTAMKAMTRNIDSRIWRDLMLNSGMMALMDAQAREQWYRNLEQDNIPEISEENILNTFEQLHHSKADVFEHGVINLFKKLSWDYKSNNPCYFGKKIIVNSLVTYNSWRFSLDWGWRRDQLADLERMLYLLDGKAIPDNRGDVTTRLSEHINQQSVPAPYEDEYFKITSFQKGTGHIVFKRQELVDEMNDIVAKHYPGMLATL